MPDGHNVDKEGRRMSRSVAREIQRVVDRCQHRRGWGWTDEDSKQRVGADGASTLHDQLQCDDESDGAVVYRIAH